MEMRDKKGLTEKEFLAQYRQKDYPRPAYTVDIALFTIMNQEYPASIKARHWIKNDKKFKRSFCQLKILLIKRGGHPYLNCWALPGGFVEPDETAKQAAIRELKEETGIWQPYLRQFYTFSDPCRDPRAWSVSTAFFSMTGGENIAVSAADDASEARWFEVIFQCIKNTKEEKKGQRIYIRDYELLLTNESNEKHCADKLKARIEVKNIVADHHIETEVSIVSSQGLAFDHAKIIAYAIYKMRNELTHSGFLFAALPKYFTLTQLQQVYEAICNKIIVHKEDYMCDIRKLIEKVPRKEKESKSHKADLYKRKKTKIWDW